MCILSIREFYHTTILVAEIPSSTPKTCVETCMSLLFFVTKLSTQKAGEDAETHTSHSVAGNFRIRRDEKFRIQAKDLLTHTHAGT